MFVPIVRFQSAPNRDAIVTPLLDKVLSGERLALGFSAANPAEQFTRLRDQLMRSVDILFGALLNQAGLLQTLTVELLVGRRRLPRLNLMKIHSRQNLTQIAGCFKPLEPHSQLAKQ